MCDLNDLHTCKNKLIWNLEMSELLLFKYSSVPCQAHFQIFSGICVTLKIPATTSWSSNGALGIEPSLDFL